MKFGFIAKHRGIWPVDVQCEALGVSRSGFYAWCIRPQSTRAYLDVAILQTIQACFAASDSTYGARRMIADVRAAVTRVGDSASRASCAERPCARGPSDGRGQAISGERALHLIADKVLDRDFTATAPNQKWVADFTYIWTHEGWLFVAVVLDLYSRRVVGWAMQATMTAQLVTDAMLMAVWRRGPAASLLTTPIRGVNTAASSFSGCSRSSGSRAA